MNTYLILKTINNNQQLIKPITQVSSIKNEYLYIIFGGYHEINYFCSMKIEFSVLILITGRTRQALSLQN